ncbi:DUF4376 domain-containing protein [Avibacterium paragallinarum]|uniref:DUF4376 domain-containing protein n=1 Tax=Avibacterium paragallinarum TaxID=728 RepID=UPI001A90E52F|nr:DUF4376 domain-containing protein [Avibacterium paragallinarum]QZP14713.1 DUF4376 domain-containing protein [Avibacterium paragallinarum]
MFYVFNKLGDFLYSCDNRMNEEDLAQRGETAVASEKVFINPVLVNGNIIDKGNAPSEYHRWNGAEWVLSTEKQAELLTDQRNQIRLQINAKRDACVNGGVYVPEIGKWVDTDEKGRATLVEIKADFDLNGKTEENGEPRIFTLICADNTAEPLDFDKFKAVWNAAKTLKEKMFENAYMHKILLEQAENPLEYDWSIGWSQTYEEYQNEQEKSI